jgi:AhpD family alkylhydroperoxidase
MNSSLLAKGARRALTQIRYVTPVAPGTADGVVARVYAQTERDFGMVAPPIALHSPAPMPLAAAWALLRETLLVPGQASRAEKEVVAAAVSDANTCPYCVTVHTAAARGLAAGPGLTPELEEIARWARSAGRPGQGTYVAPGKFPELAGVAVTFHYLNRVVSVFLPDSPLPPRLPKVAGGAFMRVLGSVMLKSRPVPGAALDLLPDAPLPAEFSWAAVEPRVAAALARAAAAIDKAAEQVVPVRIREFVREKLSQWDGRPPGPSRTWVSAALADLPASDRVAGRLAILTALAPYQVVPADVDDYRSSASGAGDEALVCLTSWASMAAARRAGSLLCIPTRQ